MYYKSHEQFKQIIITYLTCNKCDFKTDETDYSIHKLINQIKQHYYLEHIKKINIPYKPYLDNTDLPNFDNVKSIYIIEQEHEYDLICSKYEIKYKKYNDKIKYYILTRNYNEYQITPFILSDLIQIKKFIDALIENCEKFGITKI